LLLGPIEEFGWRGLALPLLQRRLAPFWAGASLGIEDGTGVSFACGKGLDEGFVRNGFPMSLARMRAKVGCNWTALPGIEYCLQDVTRVCLVTPMMMALDQMMALPEEERGIEALWDLYAHHLGLSVAALKEGKDVHMERQADKRTPPPRPDDPCDGVQRLLPVAVARVPAAHRRPHPGGGMIGNVNASASPAPTGLISDIQRFSIHDGPGIRSTVFFKGCNLRCFWCHNPETLALAPELQLYLDRCIGCGACFRACPHGAHVLQDGQHLFHRDLCRGCGACAETCYAQALVLVGRWMTVEEVMAEVRRDRPFYETSGGGVTLSGGEPLLQPEFAQALLAACRAEGLPTAIETAAQLPWARLAAALPVTDLVMMDIKLMDPQRHRAATGVGNARILANARRLGGSGVPLIARTPIIPGVNDSEADVAAIAAFVAELPNLVYYELLPFHPLAAGKYASLGMDYRARDLKAPSKERMEALAEAARRAGIPVRHR
jgi:pyruvate formate lyase activating enzyme